MTAASPADWSAWADEAADRLLPGSEDRCEACGRILDCCGNCGRCDGWQPAGAHEVRLEEARRG